MNRSTTKIPDLPNSIGQTDENSERSAWKARQLREQFIFVVLLVNNQWIDESTPPTRRALSSTPRDTRGNEKTEVSVR